MKDKNNTIDRVDQKNKKTTIVYQGEPGSYSEMAAYQYFGRDILAKGLYQFVDTFEALKNGEADYAVLPIENSTTGAIRQVYDLLLQYECYMVGETSVPIHHNLLGIPGASLSDITTVYSHEQGLFQCEQFLSQHPEWERIPAADTAGSAKMISESPDIHKAAICSSLAAEIYGLEILAPAIQSNRLNTTRFLVLSPKMESCPDGEKVTDKIFLSFSLKENSLSLAQILSLMEKQGLHLFCLEPRPIQKRKWDYVYYLELLGNINAPGIDLLMTELQNLTDDFRIFGRYESNL